MNARNFPDEEQQLHALRALMLANPEWVPREGDLVTIDSTTSYVLAPHGIQFHITTALIERILYKRDYKRPL